MVKGKKETFWDKLDDMHKSDIALFGGVIMGGGGKLIPHEIGHYAVAKTLGYAPKVVFFANNLGLAYIEVQNTTALDGLLLSAAGPIVDGIISLASVLAFVRSKNPKIKYFFGGISFASSIANAFSSLAGYLIGEVDYVNMAQSIDELGYGDAGLALPILPITVAAYCTYKVAKDYSSYNAFNPESEVVKAEAKETQSNLEAKLLK